jgi:membrane-bound lytic murein transglycosylase D
MAYLGDLHKQHGDWLLAVTAFTNGPAALVRAQGRAGGRTDFFSLYPHLPNAARDYVPAFVAACYLAHQAQSLGIQTLAVQRPANPDRIQLEQPLGFKSVAKVLKIPEDQLRGLNPVCRLEYIPGLNVPVQLCLPHGYGAKFAAMRDSIYAVQAVFDQEKAAEKLEFKDNSADEPAGTSDEDPAQGGAVNAGDEERANAFTPPPGTVPIQYTIQPGDNLGKIAQDHGVTVAQLMAANGLKNHNIKAGHRLTVYVPKSKATTPKLGPGPKLPPSEGGPKSGSADAFTWYTVQPGDNLWLISRKYPGVTDREIMELNGIGDKIQPGMKIKIPNKKP